MKTSIPRLRRVRFKDGRTLEVLRPKDENIAQRLRRSTEISIETATSPIVGFALVVWQANGIVFPNFCNGERSPILAGQVPQYAKDVLLAEVACRWVRDE